MDEVGWASDIKYKYYLYQTTTRFCNTTLFNVLLLCQLNLTIPVNNKITTLPFGETDHLPRDAYA